HGEVWVAELNHAVVGFVLTAVARRHNLPRQHFGGLPRPATNSHGSDPASVVGYRATARRSAARASSRVESSVGSGELASFMISGISGQPSTTASQPASFIRA